MVLIAKTAVSCCVYSIDKPYSYRVPASMQLLPGMRVSVPFGNGNRRTEAMVLAVEGGSEQNLKTIEQVLDDEPVLSALQMQLAAFMQERYFCTYYDAVKAILPAGLWFRTTQIVSILPSSGNWHEKEFRSPLAASVLSALEDLGGSAPLSSLRVQFASEAELGETIRYLVSKKILTTNEELSKKNGGKSEKLAELAVSVEEASAYAQKKRKTAPLQTSVLELLCSVGSGSCREIMYLTGASMTTMNRLRELGLIAITEREVFRLAVRPEVKRSETIALNHEQQSVFAGLLAQMQREKPGAALLYGVTGSGKTAVYISLIRKALEEGKTAMLLVPEIALTPQLLGKLTAHFGEKVAVLHSGLRVGERYDEWRRIRNGEASVVVGTRSAVFAPIQNPGVFIVDEEQEHTYKSENSPRYHAREIALWRGAKENALVLLGSATPSVESMYHAKCGDYSLYTLRNRYNGMALPDTQIVDLKQELRQGNTTSVSSFLEESIRDRILHRKQSILFLNRRGNSRYLVCVECGEAPECPRCSVHLTYHSVNHRLMCHYCGYSEPVVSRCPKCAGAMKPVGTGTQKIEEELRYFFPDTEVLRMDADTVSAANGHEAILERFRKEKAPILLGTQMVAKGLDFEDVTLVGVLDADMSLYVDNYRAAENTFSLLTQVVGRAGRGECAGTAVIQTMTPEHPVIKLAAQQDYDSFYDAEIRLRQLRNVPPFADIFTLTFSGLFEDAVLKGAARFRAALVSNLQKEPYNTLEALVLGPAPAPVMKVNYSFRYRLTINCKNSRTIRQLLSFLLCAFAKDPQNKGVNAFADINSFD